MVSKAVLCRVRVCSAGYKISYRTYSTVGYQIYTTVGYRYGSQELTQPVGSGIEVVQKPVPTIGCFYKGIPVTRVEMNVSYRTSRTVWYRCERLTELTEL